jgi:hypothetical protein
VDKKEKKPDVPRPRLRVKKQTLRTLRAPELHAARGGFIYASNDCTTDVY